MATFDPKLEALPFIGLRNLNICGLWSRESFEVLTVNGAIPPSSVAR